MTIFLISWFVSGFITMIILRLCVGKQPIFSYINGIVGGYYTVIILSLNAINKNLLDWEI